DDAHGDLATIGYQDLLHEGQLIVVRLKPDITYGLERDVPVFLRRVLVAFAFETPEGRNQFRASLAWTDDLVEEPPRGRDVGIRELLSELRDLFGASAGRIDGFFDFAPVQDVDGAFRPHDCELGRWPRAVEV